MAVCMKVTSQKPASFYIRAAATFLRGTEDRPAVAELEISALGNAIPAAFHAASAMEREALGTLVKVTTDYIEISNGAKSVSSPQVTITIKPATTQHHEAVGGHDDSIIFEGASVWKKLQEGGDAKRAEVEHAFIQKASGIPGLCDYVPKYQGIRTISGSRYVGMSNILAGLVEPAVMDLKMGTQTWSPNATPEKIESQRKKAQSSTTGKCGVRLVGGKLRLTKGGEWVRTGYKNDKDPANEEELKEEIARFLCCPALRKQAAEHVDRLSAWFSTQREFAFYASSLLLAYDTVELPEPRQLRFGMIDFAHVEDPPEGGDQSYMAALAYMQRILSELVLAS